MESSSRTFSAAGTSSTVVTQARELGDFTTDTRLLMLVPMAAVVGVIGAVTARALVFLIAIITNVSYYHRLSQTMVSPAANQLGVGAVLVPVVGALIIGIMARFGSEKIRGHGIPEAMEAILIGQSRMDAKVAILKPVASALAIGTGGPFGAEGPIIMTGGAFGSLFAQAFHLTASERKTLLVAGAAAGMSAIFATPLAAVLISVELLLFEWKPRSFVPVATAVVIAAVLRVPLLGPGPLFPIAPHAPLAWRQLLDCVAAGLVAGLGAAMLTGMVYAAEDAFGRLPLHFMWWPMIGGLVVGIGGLIEPRALGVGYDTIRDLLSGSVGSFVIALLVVKAVTWSIALGSGTSGGVLAPLLIMGGALGTAEARWMHAADPGLWAMVSMAAMMGGTMRSPLTAVVFLVELTHDVAMLPALLVGCVTAHALTVLVMKRSILTEKVARRGYHVTREYSVSPFARHRVEDVMDHDVPCVPAAIQVDDVLRRVLDHDPVLGERQAWPVVDETGALMGLVTRGDLVRAIDATDDENATTVLDIGARSLVVTYPDELLETALERMSRSGVGRLPVVARHDPRRLLGMLGRQAIAAAYLDGLNDDSVREAGETLKFVRRAAQRLKARITS